MTQFTNVSELHNWVFEDLQFVCQQTVIQSELLRKTANSTKDLTKKLHRLIHSIRLSLNTWEKALYDVDIEFDKPEECHIHKKIDNQTINFSLIEKKKNQLKPNIKAQRKQNYEKLKICIRQPQTIKDSLTPKENIKIEKLIVDEPQNKHSNVDNIKLMTHDARKIKIKLVDETHQNGIELLRLLKKDAKDNQVFVKTDKNKKEKLGDDIYENNNNSDEDTSSSASLNFLESKSKLSNLSDLEFQPAGDKSDSEVNKKADKFSGNVQILESNCKSESVKKYDGSRADLKPLGESYLISPSLHKQSNKLCDLNSNNKRNSKKSWVVRKRKKMIILSTSSSSSSSS